MLCTLYEGKKGQEPVQTPPNIPTGSVPKGTPLWPPLHVFCSAKLLTILSVAVVAPGSPVFLPTLSLRAGAAVTDQCSHPDRHTGLSRLGKAVVLTLVGGWETKNGFQLASLHHHSLSLLPPDLLWALHVDQHPAFIGRQPQQSSISRGANGSSSTCVWWYQALGNRPPLYLSSNPGSVQETGVPPLKVTASFPPREICPLRLCRVGS